MMNVKPIGLIQLLLVVVFHYSRDEIQTMLKITLSKGESIL